MRTLSFARVSGSPVHLHGATALIFGKSLSFFTKTERFTSSFRIFCGTVQQPALLAQFEGRTPVLDPKNCKPQNQLKSRKVPPRNGNLRHTRDSSGSLGIAPDGHWLRGRWLRGAYLHFQSPEFLDPRKGVISTSSPPGGLVAVYPAHGRKRAD